MQYAEWSRLLKADKKGMCHCPCHSDQKRSLKLSDGKDRVLIRCFAGCSAESIVEAVGKKMSDLFYEERHNDNVGMEKWVAYIESREKRKLESVYNYIDADTGNYAYTKIRLSGKKFIFGILKDGRFTYGLNGKKRKDLKGLYCKDLAKLKKTAAEGGTVCITEGEKDTDNLYSCGFVSVTCGSSNDWNRKIKDIFQGAAVVVFADNDQPGINLTRQIEKDLQGTAKTVKVIIPTPDKPHGDISDYLQEHTPEELKELIARADEKKPLPKVQKKILTEPEAIALSNSQPLDLRRNKFEKVTNDFINYTDIVEHDAYLSGKISYDMMAIRPMVRGFYWELDPHPITDNDYANIRRYMSNVYGISNKSDCQQAVNLVARKNSYHPIRQFFDGLEWDGVERVPDLFPRFLGAKRCRYTTVFTELVFSSIIERIYCPGTKQDTCYILADTLQGSGKSTMCRYLAISDEYFTDELKDFKDQAKAFEKIQGKMVCEMAEMLSIRRAKDVESVKAYLSQRSDDYRVPYATCSERYLRQVTFLATSNKPQFLPEDPTGNRRFMPLICNGRQAKFHPVVYEKEAREFIINCYAEMLHRRKEQGRLSVVVPHDLDEEVKELQEMSAPENTMIGEIQNWLDTCKENIVCSKMIWKGIYSDPDRPTEPSKYDLLDVADIMNLQVAGWERYKGKNGNSKTGKYRFEKYGPQRAWQRIVSSDGQAVDTKPEAGGHKNEDSDGFMKIPDEDELPFI